MATVAATRGSDGRLRIAMCCDFFYPRLGGVEMHIWSLSQCLLRQGHKVIVITHMTEGSEKRQGIRYMTNNLKVYYLPLVTMVDNVTLPTFTAGFALFRTVLIRERIQIVHGHQATSAFMHECIVQAKTMGYKAIYTDHSLFGFADAASVHLNKVMKFTLSDIDHAICVSHTCRENLVLRASLDPTIVSTIPNAVDATKFTPKENSEAKPPTDPLHDPITVVIISRLVYRKGIDLVGKTIELVCARCPNVKFLIGGDGNKRLLLEEMREKCQLHDRVTLWGAVPHAEVRNVLSQGHIFLNSSLTESFCIAILEAAACGLYVVSTRVGGVPEVLPPDMIRFSKDITPEDLADAVVESLPLLAKVNKQEFHDRVQQMYNWDAVAARTERVYRNVIELPTPSLIHRFRKIYGMGPVAGIIGCIIASCLFMYLQFLEYRKPYDDIEVALEFPPPATATTDEPPVQATA
ncbi:hypothetical protein SPRG_05544 [Saprolegnia parasitica CBS 223.65]|uniref:phosphatidylinositol N-acetylglucosaminyltransferase n=1 Tax=Saprolegnia parasitica (strain CBS 223.65) TaxID=695850 RepID=A0A067CST6_SAPPC|nr:hypothetical protein SPRG_05544 [Saprolegnia parasitica CBS 223.65]KDO29591.1 hypothetical protein SPRG_05544 [Saprolegnia parasitica CBS 223.65]|eukprot:XP_012199652.1 hypothetical protein SPRG_05544 [Saprolegnia parasitica CBS 223.65]